MNAIMFQLKRAWRAAVTTGRWTIRVVADMTPARFDIMLLLRNAALEREEETRNYCFMEQSRIVRELGLHKSTVSEALARLEELGWVKRFRDCDDRRIVIVEMTELGLARTWEACKLLYRQKLLKRPVDRIVRLLEPLRPFNEAFERVWQTINGLARFFGDTSTFGFYDRGEGGVFPQWPDGSRVPNYANGFEIRGNTFYYEPAPDEPRLPHS